MYKATRGKLFVQPEEQKAVTAGGIVIPNAAAERPRAGTVVSCGAEIPGPHGGLSGLDFGAGDKVIFGKFTGTEQDIDGYGKVVILDHSDIIAVWSE